MDSLVDWKGKGIFALVTRAPKQELMGTKKMNIEELIKNYSNTIQFIGVIISAFTLYLAYKINSRFGKNHIRTKQIDHVCSLIEYLNAVKIKVIFSELMEHGGISGSGFGLSFNIFEIGNYDSIEPKGQNENYEGCVVLFDKKSNQILDTKKFIDHPLTPRKLADILLNFCSKTCFYINPGERNILQYDSKLSFVQISGDIFEENLMRNDDKNSNLIRGDALAYRSWNDLKVISQQLKYELGQWLIENGIKENNIREDFKSPY